MTTAPHIVISRTDSIGDVVLTLPLAGFLKAQYPDCRISLLGQHYTRPLAEYCRHIDGFLDWKNLENESPDARVRIFRQMKADVLIHVFPVNEIARISALAGIPVRIGTAGRWWNWLYCNKVIRFSRKKSDLHESQLNWKLLKGLSITRIPDLAEIPAWYGLDVAADAFQAKTKFDPLKKHLILHPGSRGSAREWGIDNFYSLAALLPEENYQIFITGTAAEGESLRGHALFSLPNIQNLCGMFSLSELMAFIAACDALVACSTGPLHLAAALGIRAIGIYPPIRPMHPGRWAPLGRDVIVHVAATPCNKCKGQIVCSCIRDIRPEDVAKSGQTL